MGYRPPHQCAILAYMARIAPKRFDPHRLFNREGFVHYRRGYAPVELMWGLVILFGLGAILSWVLYMGAHPDPALFRSLIPAEVARPPIQSEAGQPATAPQAGPASARPAPQRGPLPTKLATPGWSEGPPSHYGDKNLYVKINGRETYYKAFGFRQLHCLTLTHTTGTTIDIELYDLAAGKNALGAYAGEKGAEEKSERGPLGTSRIARNALYLARGKYYLRAIGADEKPHTVQALAALRQRFFAAKGLGGAKRPYAYALFARLGIDADQVTYIKENAFSFQFARDVYAARVDKEGTQLFVIATKDDATATKLARSFQKGFASYGAPIQAKDGRRWLKDRYIGALSTAKAVKRWVVGARSAPNLAAAAQLPRLEQALLSSGEQVKP